MKTEKLDVGDFLFNQMETDIDGQWWFCTGITSKGG